ncbi:F-box protein, partial [Trifolium pratense]
SAWTSKSISFVSDQFVPVGALPLSKIIIILPFKVPHFQFPLEDNNNITSLFYLSKQNIYLIKPPPQQQQTLPNRSWLIKTYIHNSTGKTQLLHPLFPTYSPLPFHHVIDFNRFSTLHLGTNFTFPIDNPSYAGDHYIYPKKVVIATSHREKPLVLGNLFRHCVQFKCGDENWNDFPGMQTKYLQDICLFKGQPFAFVG